MEWKIEQAKNGMPTLRLNSHYIYSKYNPVEGAEKWILQEVNREVDYYILIGLGLGYHLLALIKITQKKIIVLTVDEQEKLLCKELINSLDSEQVVIFQSLDALDFTNDNFQLLLPTPFVNAIGNNHPLKFHLETIKMKQSSLKKAEQYLKRNFMNNIQLKDSVEYKKPNHPNAVLISSGPTLQETISWIEPLIGYVDVYVVGSALQFVLNSGIKPFATIITDPFPQTIKQLDGVDYSGDLYYLCTADYSTVTLANGKRFILFQEGYKLAEQYAQDKVIPLLQTGGSVATTAFSLIEFLGYKKLFLFGQDFGFKDKESHFKGSTSGNSYMDLDNLYRLQANSGELIYTLKSLKIYWQWFNNKAANTKLNVYNTAFQGAKIENVPYISREQFTKFVKLKTENR